MEIIILLLMLMPGMVAMYIDQAITAQSKSSKTDYEWVFRALVFNVPAFGITWALLMLANSVSVLFWCTSKWELYTLNVFSEKLHSISFIMLYLMFSLIAGIIVGRIIAYQRNEDTVYYDFLNSLRKSHGKADLLGAPSPWDKCFNNRNEPVIEIIRSDGSSVKGFLRDFSLGNEPRELKIDAIDVADKWHEYLNKVESVYYHLDSDTLIKLYDTSEYITKLKEMGVLKN